VNNLKKYSTLIIIGILLLIILLQRSCTGDVVVQEPISVVKVDTIWKITHDTIIKKIRVTDIRYVKPLGPEYTPGIDLDTCQKRFEKLLHKHVAKTTYKDTLVLDSLGTITVIDTVWMNKLTKRIYLKDYKIPFVTKTVTITKQADPKRQIYLGTNFFANKTAFSSVAPGIMYKDRKDRVYQANVGINTEGIITYGLGLYWKINLNKK
jgi:hypothetical protein